MTQLHPSDREALRRAGFTEREINTQQRKFYNLTQISPCYTDELRQFQQLMEDRRALLEALKRLMGGTTTLQDAIEANQQASAAIAKATGKQK